MRQVAKAIAALLGGLSTWGVTAAADGNLSAAEWFGLPALVGAAILVWAVPNAEAGA